MVSHSDMGWQGGVGWKGYSPPQEVSPTGCHDMFIRKNELMDRALSVGFPPGARGGVSHQSTSLHSNFNCIINSKNSKLTCTGPEKQPEIPEVSKIEIQGPPNQAGVVCPGPKQAKVEVTSPRQKREKRKKTTKRRREEVRTPDLQPKIRSYFDKLNRSTEKFRAELTSLPSLEIFGRTAKRKRESEHNNEDSKKIRPDEQGRIIRMSQRGIQKT